MDTVMDKDLQDDLLKLVRYKILFVRREFEVAFPEQEDIVSDNMDGDAFSAWKVAEFIQDLPDGEVRIPAKWLEQQYPPAEFRKGNSLIGLPHEDKKYLRVYYEVLERYPREKFKYEEQQIRVLEEIRDKVQDMGIYATLLGDPYDEPFNRLRLSSATFAAWKDAFRRCADKISHDLAHIFNKYREVGHFVCPPVPANQIKHALTAPPEFDRSTLDRFTGPTTGDVRFYVPQNGSEQEIPTPALYSIWGPATTRPNNPKEFIQKITGSIFHHFDPGDTPTVWKAIANQQLDQVFNAYTEDCGLVSWTASHQGPPLHLRSLGYELGGRILWINQWLNADMSPVRGSPLGQPFVDVKENQLILSIDFPMDEAGKHYFCVYAMHINFDFENCSATFAGPIMKMKNLVITDAEKQ